MPEYQSPNIGFVRSEVSAMLPQWALVDDCVSGEGAIKAKGETYLPKPETNTDPVKNEALYKKYKLRAVFYPVTGRTLEGLCGQVFSKPIQTELPTQLDQLVMDVDGAATTLEQQAKQVLRAGLKHGRSGLLSDFPRVGEGAVVTRADLEQGRIRPRILFYRPSQIINWSETVVGGESRLSLLVLQEQKNISADKFEPKMEDRWRVYGIDEAGNCVVTLWKKVDANPRQGERPEYEIDEPTAFVNGSNNQPLNRIPFSFVGSTNNDSSVDDSPLYPLAILNVAHYRNSADYEQSLFLCGQPTPVFTGLTDDWVKSHITGKVTLGSQSAIPLPPNATAQLLQATSNTMPMEGMKHKEEQMKAIGAKLIEGRATQQTATEAEIEETSEASVLSSVAKNVSAAYELAFYFCSLFIGEVEKESISIQLNSEFQVLGLNATERQEVVSAWQAGVLTWEEARDVYRRKGIAYLDDNEAQAMIDAGNISLGSSQPDMTPPPDGV